MRFLFRMTSCWALCLSLWAGMVACAPALVDPNADGGASFPDGNLPFDKPQPIEGPALTFEDLDKGVTKVTVNATTPDTWVYFSFAKKEPQKPTDPKNSKDWDIAFQRYLVISNSGIHGNGGVEVAIVKDKDLAGVTEAPKEGYLTDKEDSDDELADPDTPFLVDGNWFLYNIREHLLKVRQRVFVVKATDGKKYKMQMLKYYDSKGRSGFPTFSWAPLP